MYWTLLVKWKEGDDWQIEFGGYELQEIADQLEDMEDERNFYMICVIGTYAATQESIDEQIAKMNK